MWNSDCCSHFYYQNGLCHSLWCTFNLMKMSKKVRLCYQLSFDSWNAILTFWVKDWKTTLTLEHEWIMCLPLTQLEKLGFECQNEFQYISPNKKVKNSCKINSMISVCCKKHIKPSYCFCTFSKDKCIQLSCEALVTKLHSHFW